MRRGLAILLALGAEEGAKNGGLGVSQVARLVGREKSQVSRSLKVLEEFGVVERDAETRGYRLGWRLFALAGQAGDPSLLDAGPPLLLRLVDELGETAHLSVLQGAEVLTVLSESPNRAVQAAGWTGRTVPAYCTSSGQALLFDFERSELEALLAEVEFDCAGPRAPRDLDDLFGRISAARDRGFALVDEEFEPGLVAVAAPVRDFSGGVVAAINVSAPKFRFGSRLEAAGEAVQAVASQLSARLGSPAANGGTKR